MLTANGLKEIGYELIDVISEYFKGNKSDSVDNSECYEQINLKNGFFIQSTKWRRGAMPFYIVTFNPKGHYIFELDLSMIIENSEDNYSWNLKNPSNTVNRNVCQNMFGNIVKFNPDYIKAVMDQKKSINSGINTPRNGFTFINQVTWDILCKSLCQLMLAILKAHSTSQSDEIINQAEDDDINLFGTSKARIRHDQRVFRRNLIDLYEGKCAISGWSPTEALDAVHIVEHCISGINHTDNGLLLRADIHRLFDKHLLKINPKTLKVHVTNDLKNTEYWYFNNMKISKRKDGKYPSINHLTTKWG